MCADPYRMAAEVPAPSHDLWTGREKCTGGRYTECEAFRSPRCEDGRCRYHCRQLCECTGNIVGGQ